ncbi:MAG: hypothetical protein LLG08_04105 [Actinomycetia bacterium]|nr:hypothetical protein [Actinomycetes bacterium]
MQVAILVLVTIIAAVVLLSRGRKPDSAEPDKPILPKNNPPVAHEPLVVGAESASLFIGDPVKLDLRHRVHGCDANGNPLTETGAYDPEGDVLEYMVKCEGAGRDGTLIPYSVFSDRGVKVDTAWIKNGDPHGFALAPKGPYDQTLEPQAIVTFFVGWRDAATPYPFTPKGCDPAPAPEPIIDKTKLGECRFTYTVRDTKGHEASGSRIWTVYDGCRK